MGCSMFCTPFQLVAGPIGILVLGLVLVLILILILLAILVFALIVHGSTPHYDSLRQCRDISLSNLLRFILGAEKKTCQQAAKNCSCNSG